MASPPEVSPNMKATPQSDDEENEESSSPTPDLPFAALDSHTPSKKRKRPTQEIAELSIDVSAPEPPSKKALRKAKKSTHAATAPEPPSTHTEVSALANVDRAAASTPATTRSAHCIWIGNLPWQATNADLRAFFIRHAHVAPDAIGRVHMPAPSQPAVDAGRKHVKPKNKGFAYIDFTTEEAHGAALALSETLMTGRRVLIKDAKNFEGRPEKVREEKEDSKAKAAPNKRVFVGNLGFDTTTADLREHFATCGVVEDVFIATFEDTGKCKGYAWVTFGDVDAAEKAVRGWIEIGKDSGAEDSESEGKSRSKSTKNGNGNGKSKLRKWWINRLKGQSLRMEIAEDATTRYKKRYGKGRDNHPGDQDPIFTTIDRADAANDAAVAHRPKSRPLLEKGHVRTVKSGAAVVGVQRLTGAIVESTGTKMVFDE